jgi:DNA-binding response OmpR family regulator
MSRMMNILVLEDDPFVSMDIEMIVADILPAVIRVSSSVAEASKALTTPLDLALLDIDVLDGKSFPLASRLRDLNTPIIFVSGSRPEELPPHLRDAPFVSKPYAPKAVEALIRDTLKIEHDAGKGDRAECRPIEA